MPFARLAQLCRVEQGCDPALSPGEFCWGLMYEDLHDSPAGSCEEEGKGGEPGEPSCLLPLPTLSTSEVCSSKKKCGL